MVMKRILRTYNLQKGKKQLQTTYPTELSDSLKARGVEYVYMEQDGETITIRPVEPEAKE